MAEFRKPLPQPTPETEDFWEGAKAGQLRLQRCTECSKVYFPPRPFCPACASRAVESFNATGRATLHSYVINHRPAPGFESEAPYAIAAVMLDEGVKMLTNLVNIEQMPEALQLDMPLEVTFDPEVNGIRLPKFQPVGGGR